MDEMTFRNRYGDYDSITSSVLSLIGAFLIILGILGVFWVSSPSVFVAGGLSPYIAPVSVVVYGVLFIIGGNECEKKKRASQYQEEDL